MTRRNNRSKNSGKYSKSSTASSGVEGERGGVDGTQKVVGGNLSVLELSPMRRDAAAVWLLRRSSGKKSTSKLFGDNNSFPRQWVCSVGGRGSSFSKLLKLYRHQQQVDWTLDVCQMLINIFQSNRNCFIQNHFVEMKSSKDMLRIWRERGGELSVCLEC